MHRPETVFPELAADILRRRASDPEFDEICKDFELLANSRQTATGDVDSGGKRSDSAIEEALADLSREINALIRPNAQASS